MNFELATFWLIDSGLQASRSAPVAPVGGVGQESRGRSEHACNCLLNGAEAAPGAEASDSYGLVMLCVWSKERPRRGLDWIGSCVACGRLPVSADRQRAGNRPVPSQARTTNAGGVAALLNSTPLSVAARTVAAFTTNRLRPARPRPPVLPREWPLLPAAADVLKGPGTVGNN